MDGDNIQDNTKVELDNKEIQQVSAATYKKVYYKKYYKKWYKSYGRWKYYWKSYWTYKYVKKSSSVKATSTTSSKTYKSGSSSSGSVSTSGLSSTASYINRNYNHRSGASTTASGVRRTGYGDCWGLADLAAQELKKKGYTVRVVQGASRGSSRHRWVQYKSGGKWKTFESTMVTKRYGSKHYSYAIATARTVIKYY
ncbi:MAG: hypothetical protein CIT01_05580 [Methanobacterium sp. BRmetb2]|nr:MAG: hypothetical protein CIT01_05580 [Methanobacterium sp. BRmetb2]